MVELRIQEMMNYILGWFRKYQVLRYLASGFLANVVFFGVLVLLKEILQIWYLYASSIAYLIALVASFNLQKFWTFRSMDTRTSTFTLQAVLYGLNSALGFFLNGFIVYLAVERLHLWYIIGQLLATSFFAVFSFFVFSVIFKKSSSHAVRK